MTNPPVTVSGPEWDGGLWWMVLASGAAHVVAIIVLLLIPHSFLHQPPALHSYTVDLIAPDRLGGTNMVTGGKGRVEGAPLAAAPPAPKVEPPKPPPQAEQPKPEPPKPQEKPEPPQVASKPEPQPAAPPAPPPAPPKAEAKPKEEEAVIAKKVEPAKPTPPSAAPSPQAQPAPQAVAKAEPAKPAGPPVKSEAQTAAEAKAAKEAKAAHDRDERIAAAIKRVEQQNGVRGGGSGEKAAEQPGGPISVGPGHGAGGAVKGVEYLLYYNQMINRIKQSWAWAGADRSLEAVVRFNITEDGEVLNVRIAHPSGDASYDWSVERAVKAATPLPPPPEAYRKEFGDVELTFSPEQLQR